MGMPQTVIENDLQCLDGFDNFTYLNTYIKQYAHLHTLTHTDRQIYTL